MFSSGSCGYRNKYAPVGDGLLIEKAIRMIYQIDPSMKILHIKFFRFNSIENLPNCSIFK